MSATATRSAARSQPHGLKALGVFGAVGVVALAATLVAGATGVFNVLVFVLFAVLWLWLAAALVLARAELDEFWRAFRRRSVVVQSVGWRPAERTFRSRIRESWSIGHVATSSGDGAWSSACTDLDA